MYTLLRRLRKAKAYCMSIIVASVSTGRLRQLLLINIIIIFVNLFLVISQLDRHFVSLDWYFRPNISPSGRKAMLATLRQFIQALEAANITAYFLYGGSLIGSYRHHGPIPWDDDIDIMADSSHRRDIYKALQKLAPRYGLIGSFTDTWQWKFFDNYSTESYPIMRKPFKWPYVDLFFYAQNDTHIWDDNPLYSKQFCWPKSYVFPIMKRPFADLFLSAPCNSAAVLAQNYDLDMCQTRSFNHGIELPTAGFLTKAVDCSLLYHMFPFVTSRLYNNTTSSYTEILSISEWNISSVNIPVSTECISQY